MNQPTMNVDRLLQRGVRYAKEAANVFWSRKEKLILAWVRFKNDGNGSKMTKVWPLSCEMDERVRLLCRSIQEHEERQQQSYIRGENELIELICLACRYNPRAIGKAVKLKDYERAKYKCPTCGRPMESKEDRAVTRMLLDQNLRLNSL